MGGGTSGLFPATNGAKPHQLSLTPEPISIRHRGPTYDIRDSGIGAGVSDIGVRKKDRVLLFTPHDVLKKCLHWRIGAISEGNLIRWIELKLANRQLKMIPLQLRSTLIGYVLKLKNTNNIGKGYDKEAFLALIIQLEKELENME